MHLRPLVAHDREAALHHELWRFRVLRYTRAVAPLPDYVPGHAGPLHVRICDIHSETSIAVLCFPIVL